jgi:hypothetical protein
MRYNGIITWSFPDVFDEHLKKIVCTYAPTIMRGEISTFTIEKTDQKTFVLFLNFLINYTKKQYKKNLWYKIQNHNLDTEETSSVVVCSALKSVMVHRNHKPRSKLIPHLPETSSGLLCLADVKKSDATVP